MLSWIKNKVQWVTPIHNRTKQFLAWLYLMSIWHPDAIPKNEWKYRNQKRVMFPAIDVLFILGGFSAAKYGIPAISEFFPDSFVDGFAYILSIAGLVCLIGVSFPRLWAIELGGKSVALSLLVGYILSLLILTAAGEGNRGFVLIIACIASSIIIWRISLLGSEWQDRVTAQKVNLNVLLERGDE